MNVAKLKQCEHEQSVFYKFNEDGTFIICACYVDDLLLSGPEAHHEQFWIELGKYVNIDPPEPVGRFIGRNHDVLEHNSTGRVMALAMCDMSLTACY